MTIAVPVPLLQGLPCVVSETSASGLMIAPLPLTVTLLFRTRNWSA